MCMNGTLTLGSYGAVSRGCPMGYGVMHSDFADFTFGQSPGHYFEFGFDAESLRQFVTLATKALAEMDALHAQKNAKKAALGNGPDAGELVMAGEQSA